MKGVHIMRINIIINDETIREEVKEAVQFAEWDNFIGFPDGAAREEFIDGVTDEIISKYEIYCNYKRIRFIYNK